MQPSLAVPQLDTLPEHLPSPIIIPHLHIQFPLVKVPILEPPSKPPYPQVQNIDCLLVLLLRFETDRHVYVYIFVVGWVQIEADTKMGERGLMGRLVHQAGADEVGDLWVLGVLPMQFFEHA